MRDINFEADLERYPYPRPFFKDQSIWAIWVYRCGRRLMNRQPSLLRIVLFKLYWPLFKMVETITGISISLDAEIGPGLRIYHFGNVFIGGVIGRNCTLRNGVTIGHRSEATGWPVIGDDVEFGVGAVAIGSIHIGSGTKIGPLSVVTSDVPENSIVLGNPGKIYPRIGSCWMPSTASTRSSTSSARSTACVPPGDLSAPRPPAPLETQVRISMEHTNLESFLGVGVDGAGQKVDAGR